MPRPNKGPRLEQNAVGIWEIRWTDKGRSKRVSTRATSLSEAQRVFAGWILEKDRSAEDAPLTVHDAIDLYRKYHVEPNATDKVRIDTCLDFFKKFFREDRTVESVTQSDIVDYGDRRRSGKLASVKGPVKDGTIHRELAMLSAAFNFCARKLKRVSRDDVPFIAKPPKSPVKDYWLTDEQLDKMMAEAKATFQARGRLPRIYRFIAIARYTAARKSAILNLTWFQVDLEHRLIDFRKPGERQTKKRKVAVPISDALLPILKAAYAEKVSEYVLDHTGHIHVTFAKVAKRAGVPDATPHTLRHSWATNAARKGVSMWQIAGVLGDNVNTVINNYLHHSPDHLRDAVNGAVSGALRSDGADPATNNGRQ